MAENKRYPSDLTDAQWELIEPLVPAPRSGGRPAVHSRRRIVDAIMYVNRTGCAWRQLPHDFPPWATVFWYFKRWREDGVVDRLHDAVRDRVRDASDRDPMASAGCVDAQSVKGADTVAAAVRGFDAGKKVNGRKRHVVVDTMGLLLLVLITSARRRWVVERTFAWIVKCRRLDHDYERLPETSEAMIKWAMIGLMVRRLEPPPGRKPWQRASTAA